MPMHYVENQVHEAGMFMRQHHHEWGGVFPQKLLEQQKKIRIIGCAKNVGQSRVAGQIVSKFDKESIAKGETALVLADEQLLFPVLNNLADIETLNITMGAPLTVHLYSPWSICCYACKYAISNTKEVVFTIEMCKSFCAIRIAHTSLSKLSYRQCSKILRKKTWCL